MDKQIKTIESFYFIGIFVKPNNNNRQGSKEIPSMWSRFLNPEERWSEKISNKIDDSIINVYTDYETDHDGNYTSLLGYKVTSLDNIPEGAVGRQFESCKCEVYNLEIVSNNTVMNKWQEIWNQPSEYRAYTYDFDHYQVNPTDPTDIKVDLHVSIK